MSGSESDHSTLESVLVIGGCGFLGRHIVKGLLEDVEKPRVIIFDKDVSRNQIQGAEYFEGDLTSAEDVKRVFDQVKPQVVIHSASLIAGHGTTIPDDVKKFVSVNIDGTANILKHAKESPSTEALVYTSSVSATASKNLYMATEALTPLETRIDPLNPYDGTKSLAESLVLSSNSRLPSPVNGLRTCALRLTGIYGTGDFHVLYPALMKIKSGDTNLQIGDGIPQTDFLFVENGAHAHILAAKALLRTPTTEDGEEEEEEEKRVDGEAFFITDDHPISFWAFSRKIWEQAGFVVDEKEVRVIPRWVILGMCFVLEWGFWVCTLGKRHPAALRRCIIEWCCVNRTFDISKAKERLGYKPKYETDEALKISVAWGLKYEAEQEANKKTV